MRGPLGWFMRGSACTNWVARLDRRMQKRFVATNASTAVFGKPKRVYDVSIGAEYLRPSYGGLRAGSVLGCELEPRSRNRDVNLKSPSRGKVARRCRKVLELKFVAMANTLKRSLPAIPLAAETRPADPAIVHPTRPTV